MTESFADLKTRILASRPVCEICDIAPAVELHHCIVHDSKDMHKWVTVEENLMGVCSSCHPYANSVEIRMRFVRTQIERGYDVAGWYASLPLKYKEDWLLHLGE